MDKFAVDLDKVLDEFELNEDRVDELTAGRETKPSGYQEYLKANGDTVYAYNDCVPLSQVCPPALDRSTKPHEVAVVSSLRYDFPYEPTDPTFDLADADFAPTARTSSGAPSRVFAESDAGRNDSVPLGSPMPTVSTPITSNGPSNGHHNQISTILPQQPTSKTAATVPPSLSTQTDSSLTTNNVVMKSAPSSVFSPTDIGNGGTSKRTDSECSADRYMHDIEVVMGTGLPLSAFCSDSKAETTNFTLEELNEIFSGVSGQVADDGVGNSSELGRTVCEVQETITGVVREESCTVPSTDAREHSIDAESGESFQLPVRSDSKVLPGSTEPSAALISDASDKFAQQTVQMISISRQNPAVVTNGLETVGKHSLPIDMEVRSATSPGADSTPFETPLELAESDVSSSPGDHVSSQTHSDYATPVGFSADVELSDTELEKYLKEAEDNEKLALTSNQEPDVNEANPSSEQVTRVVNELDGFSSGEEFYSPMMERPASQAELSRMDPYFAGNTIKPDQVYEEVCVDGPTRDPKPIGELEAVVTDAGLHRSKKPKPQKGGKRDVSADAASTGARPKQLAVAGEPEQIFRSEAGEGMEQAPIYDLTQAVGDNTPTEVGSGDAENWTDRRVFHDAINRELAQKGKLPDMHHVKEQQNLEIKNQLQSGSFKVPEMVQSPTADRMLHFDPPADEVVSVSSTVDDCDGSAVTTEESVRSSSPDTNGSAEMAASKRQRPTSLNLSGKIEIAPSEGAEVAEIEEQTPTAPSEQQEVLVPESHEVSEPSIAESESSEPWDGAESASTPLAATPPEEVQLGKVAPFWIPDAEAPTCMQCHTKFTVLKRRHHCRACGRVLCSQCCGMKARLQYMENREARVCQQCVLMLSKVQAVDQWPQSAACSPSSPASLPPSCLSSPSAPTPTRSPNPNNPNEYCSTIPPMQQALAKLNAPPPTVLVPVGVLKRQGSKTRGEPKQVIFSDGIRPGGDLTELDSPVTEPKPPFRRPGRVQKKVEKPSDCDTTGGQLRSPPASSSSSKSSSRLPALPPHVSHFIPDGDNRVPPIISSTGDYGEYSIDDLALNPEDLYAQLIDKESSPIVFVVNKNLFVSVKIVTLDCCMNRTCWCFTTRGLCTVGQEEMVVVLECLPDEKALPKDVLHHFSSVYEEASQGNTVTDLGHTIFTQSFLGSREHGGFLYIRPNFQCLNKLILPPQPYLVGVLLQKWETPWAKVFPIRLMLRLGAEFRYYPCPLVSVRFRKPVYCEIGHTIMNLLADFRNYQYMLPTIKGMVIHMEDKKTYISFPRNRYDETMKALNNSNDHVLGLSGNFSLNADSHLVCIQNDDGNYETQAINIQNKPRVVTGASFVVFNGALKSSSGLTAKSSIVEDGLMVQIPPDTMVALRQALRDMQNFTISCGSVRAEQPDEEVMIQWVDDDRNVNIGVKSTIDGMAMDGIASIYIHGGTDYMGENYLIRWTEVFLIQSEESTNSRRIEPVNISRLSEILAQACCIALTAHLDSLRDANLTKIGLRVTIDSENVGYEIGSRESRLPAEYMNDLDTELVPVIHRAASQSQESPTTLELVFHVMDQ